MNIRKNKGSNMSLVPREVHRCSFPMCKISYFTDKHISKQSNNISNKKQHKKHRIIYNCKTTLQI